MSLGRLDPVGIPVFAINIVVFCGGRVQSLVNGYDCILKLQSACIKIIEFGRPFPSMAHEHHFVFKVFGSCFSAANVKI
jgi:hypothetical protein